ncbi:uncharacterized protein [Drosophila suzukii]|uniref:Uncharacterized protein n=1 Tax=Drosophila suzukii TaxID=28584 RepID=A0ABM4TPV0_DROSZ
MPKTRLKKQKNDDNTPREIEDTPRPGTSAANLLEISMATVMRGAASTQKVPERWDEEAQSNRSHQSQRSVKAQKLQLQMEHLQKQQELKAKRMQLEFEEKQLELEMQMQMTEIEEDNRSQDDQDDNIGDEYNNGTRTRECVKSSQRKQTHQPDDINSNAIVSFMARQTIKQELPLFSGDPLEWPIFIAEYENSSQVCKFTDYENINRLRKALTDKDNTASASLDMPSNPDQNKTIPDMNCNINFGCNKVLLKVIPVTLIGPQKAIETYALLDEASTISLIDEQLATDLQLEGPTSPAVTRYMNKRTQR